MDHFYGVFFLFLLGLDIHSCIQLHNDMMCVNNDGICLEKLSCEYYTNVTVSFSITGPTSIRLQLNLNKTLNLNKLANIRQYKQVIS